MSITLKALLRSGVLPALDALATSLPGPITLLDPSSKVVYGPNPTVAPEPLHDLGHIAAPPPTATAVSTLLHHWAAKEKERRALAAEVLHLYREVNLFEQLSTQLASIPDANTIGEAALAQARRLITATAGAVYVDALPTASFGDIQSLAPRATATIGENYLAAPLQVKGSTIGAIVLEGADYSSVDLKLLNTIALQAGVALENARAILDREQLAALRQELDTARTIQHSLVPGHFPEHPQFDLHASMTSAKAVGGDFYDFFLIDSNRLGIVLGDVSGKGVPSALYMAVTRTQIKGIALQGMPPNECLQLVNKALVRDKASSMFATCFYGILDLSTGTFDYCNAGHNPPYLLSRSGEVTPLPLAGGPPLGLFDLLPYSADSLTLNPGEAIFLYTDGVPEATDFAEADYTDDRLIASLTAAHHLPCSQLLTHIFNDVLSFTGGAPQSDDITMLALRRA